MIYVAHRINTIEGLHSLPPKYGVEIDIRGHGSQLLLNHDPIWDASKHDDLEEYLKIFAERGMAFVILNVKEAGHEQRIIELCAKYGIAKEKYFLLDVEFPYLYKAVRKLNIREIAVRYSEAEPIEAAEAQMVDGHPMLDWVWIDTNTRLPLDEEKDGKDIVARLMKFKTALVCPDRWGRPEDIDSYANEIKQKGLRLDLVMTSVATLPAWEKHFD
jgi:hypothetical protein